MDGGGFKKQLAAGSIGLVVFTLLFHLIQRSHFDARWRALKPGMTERDIRKALGEPSWKGKTEAIGAGGENVTSWWYERGRWTYSVKFDYTGPSRSLIVFRTDSWQRWRWPSWWPWRSRAIA